ncbi:MAG TPA: VOC family protein [Flavobacteriales bacterium]
MSQVKAIYVNLPISDINRTRAFWTKLGFSFNEQFSDERALCLVLREDVMYSMLITHPVFESFSKRPVATSATTQVLLCIEVESKERVDEIVRLALENGATRYREAEDHGWMYYDTFADPDGHQWEIMFSDPTLLPK